MRKYYDILHDMAVQSANNGDQEVYRKLDNDVQVWVRNTGLGVNIRVRDGFERAESYYTLEGAAERINNLLSR